VIVGSGQTADNSDPDRARRSIRRTLTVDGHRPEGFAGPIVITTRGRDLVTDAHGAPLEAGAASLGLTIAPEPAYTILAITSEPALPGLAPLIGSSARHGLRRRLLGIQPGSEDDSIVLRLLQDVPAVTTLSRLALIHDGRIAFPAQAATSNSGRQTDICAGWAAGSSMNRLVDAGRNPVGDHEDVAVDEPAGADPDGRHAAPPLARGHFRRRRRLDLIPAVRHQAGASTFGGTIEVDAMFRDTFVGEDGVERIEHEYRLRASVDVATGIVTDSSATPVVLPAIECPLARESASTLVGRNLGELALLRKDLVGTSTCTHLTEALHGYADIPDLIAMLESRPNTRRLP
jgi:Protein of unknown function (DUF2889)